MQIASKYGISYRAVEGRLRRFLRSNPSLDKELPKGQASTSVSGAAELLKDSEKLRELFRCIQEYGKEKGMKAFAQKNDISFHSVKNYYYKKKPFMSDDKSPTQERISVEQAVLDAVRKKGDLPLEKEDIQAAAERAGVHYHTALSTWGNMVANAKALVSAEPCGDRGCSWFKGDIFATLADRGMPREEIAKISGTDVAEVEKLISTCSRFPKEARTYPLPFEFYSTVADQDKPGEWLEKAVSSGWGLEELKAALRSEAVGDYKNQNKILEENERLKKALAEAEKEVQGTKEKWNEALKTTGKITSRLVEKAERLEKENAELKARLNEKVETDKKILEKKIEESINIVSLEHIVGLYETIARLESQLEAARRANVLILEALAKKNAESQKAACPVAVHQEQRERQVQEQAHIN